MKKWKNKIRLITVVDKQKMTNYKIKTKKNRGFISAGQAALEGHPKAVIFQKALHRQKVIKHWDKAISEFFEEGQNLTKVMDFKDGVLLIACLSKELAYKIKAYAQRIIYILNQLLGQELVYSIRLDY